MDTNTNDTFTIQWLSGLFEGEGSFVTNGKTKLQIQMTDLDVLESVKSTFGGSIYEVKKRENHWKDCWSWAISGERAYGLTKAMLPYLHSRRSEKAKILIKNYEQAPRTIKKSRASKIYELRDSGLLHREIAEQLGMDRSNVSHILARRGV